MESSQSTMKAPTRMPKPMGIPRSPTWMGSCPYMLKDWVGQKRRTEKKLEPEMKVITRVPKRVVSVLCMEENVERMVMTYKP